MYVSSRIVQIWVLLDSLPQDVYNKIDAIRLEASEASHLEVSLTPFQFGNYGPTGTGRPYRRHQLRNGPEVGTINHDFWIAIEYPSLAWST